MRCASACARQRQVSAVAASQGRTSHPGGIAQASGRGRLPAPRTSSLMRRWMALMSRFQPGRPRLPPTGVLLPEAAGAALWLPLASTSIPRRLHCSARTCAAISDHELTVHGTRRPCAQPYLHLPPTSVKIQKGIPAPWLRLFLMSFHRRPH